MSTEEQLYIKGFNHGYLLTKHLPDLVAKLITGIRDTAGGYFAGFFSGKEEYELEYNQIQLNELNSLRNRSNDKDRDIEKE